MPIYQFNCTDCKHSFETIAKYDEKVVCEKCQSENTSKEVGFINLYSIEGGNNSSTQGRLHRHFDKKD